MKENKEHWEKVYSEKEEQELGWYQPSAGPSLELLSKCKLPSDAHILDAGSGASVFIDDLLNAGYSNITAVDISARALEKTKERLGKEKSSGIRWVTDDLAEPGNLQNIPEVKLWHDRAVFHFLTKAEQRENYFALLNKLTNKGAFLIIATFAPHGAEKCSGLPVCRYSSDDLDEFFKASFDLITSFEHLHHNPRGDERPFTYALFRKR